MVVLKRPNLIKKDEPEFVQSKSNKTFTIYKNNYVNKSWFQLNKTIHNFNNQNANSFTILLTENEIWLLARLSHFNKGKRAPMFDSIFYIYCLAKKSVSKLFGRGNFSKEHISLLVRSMAE